MKYKKPDPELIRAWRLSKELCSEVELDGPEAEIPQALLATLHSDPKSIPRIVPPPGYEDRLVAALMAKASATQTTPVVTSTKTANAATPWYRWANKLIPVTAFSFVLVIGIAVVQYVMVPKQAPDAQADLWAKAVAHASEVEVSRWLASVEGSGAQNWSTSSDLSILSSGMNEVQLERALKENGGS